MGRILVFVVVIVLAAVMAVPAFAQGKVEQGPEHANSICSFSGLNDHDPNEPPGGRAQSYGQEISQAIKTDMLEPGDQAGKAAPGTFCNVCTPVHHQGDRGGSGISLGNHTSPKRPSASEAGVGLTLTV